MRNESFHEGVGERYVVEAQDREMTIGKPGSIERQPFQNVSVLFVGAFCSTDFTDQDFDILCFVRQAIWFYVLPQRHPGTVAHRALSFQGQPHGRQECAVRQGGERVLCPAARSSSRYGRKIVRFSIDLQRMIGKFRDRCKSPSRAPAGGIAGQVGDNEIDFKSFSLGRA